MSADDEGEHTDGGRLVSDPCDPVVIPGGPGRVVVCGRKRDRDGTRYLDTGGGS